MSRRRCKINTWLNEYMLNPAVDIMEMTYIFKNNNIIYI